jgi:hypothetical protein
MILFKLEYPTTVEAWPKPVCEFQDWGCLPDEQLTSECPDWTESVIERSFLRRPDALARVLGVTDTRHELLVLKQVARIDLYLRTHSGLHLVENEGAQGPFAMAIGSGSDCAAMGSVVSLAAPKE